MRFFVFSLLAIAAVSAVPAKNPNLKLGSASLREKRDKNTDQNCEPLKLFHKYCNTCICTADGKNATCTNEECIEGLYAEDGSLMDYNPNIKHKCLRDRHFTVNCNHCWCQFNGITAICTVDPCDDAGCEPNSVTRRDCNECTCSADGKQLTCYAKYCPDPFD